MATTTWTQGTITLTNGLATVTGHGTDWDVAELEGGETLAVVTDPPIDFSMTIQPGVSAEELTLTAPWAGTSLIGVPYQITRDYTGAPADAPIPQRGDMNPWAIMGEAFRRLNNAIGTVLSGKLNDPGSNGLVVRTGASGATAKRAVSLGANLTGSNLDGVAGDIQIALAAALAGLTSVEAQSFQSRRQVISDDAVYSFPAPGSGNRSFALLICTSSAPSPASLFWLRAGASPGPASAVILNGGNSAALTGALTGTTGADGNFSVSVDETTVYIENRRGFNVVFSVFVVGVA